MIRTVLFNGIETRMALDDPRPDGEYVWAIALARFVDEGTGMPILSGVRVETDFPRLEGRASGSVGGLYGFPVEALSNLGDQAYDLEMRVETDLHLSQVVPIHVERRLDAFASFETVPLGDVVLHRRPVILTGRCLRSATGAPVAGATAQVTKVWRVLPSPVVAVPEESAALVAIWPPLPYALDDATASVRRRNLTPSDPRPLAQPATHGDVKIVVADAAGLAPNGILRIDGGIPERLEYAIIDSLVDGVVTLKRPLTLDHRSAALVERATPGGLGAVKAVAQGALPGETSLYLSDANGLATGDQVRIQVPGEEDTYHRVSLYESVADAQGVFVLPPISRVGQIEITASSLGLNVVTRKIPVSSETRQFSGSFLL